MNTRLSALIALLLSAPPLVAQFEQLRPFRKPDRNIVAPAELFRGLRTMRALAASDPARVRVDEDGREVSDLPAWQAAWKEVQPQMLRQAGHLGAILLESNNPEDRALAAYAVFLCPDVQDICHLIAYFPGEPVRALREEGYRRALAFLRVHLPKNRPWPKDAKIPEGTPQSPLYSLDLDPYIALLSVADPVDQAQGLWFLRELVRIRKDIHRTIVNFAGARLLELLASPDAGVRREAVALVSALDPQGRPLADDAGAKVAAARLEAIRIELLPPIRRIGAGLYELHPGDARDRLVEVAREAAKTDSLGAAQEGRLGGGLYYRGYQVRRLPAPLDQLGLPLQAVLVRVNATPVASAAEVLQAVEAALARKAPILVEYVHEGREHAIEYRVILP